MARARAKLEKRKKRERRRKRLLDLGIFYRAYLDAHGRGAGVAAREGLREPGGLRGGPLGYR